MSCLTTAVSVFEATVVSAGFSRSIRCCAIRASFSCGADVEFVPPCAVAEAAACSKRLIRLRVDPHAFDGLLFAGVPTAGAGDPKRPLRPGDEDMPGKIPGRRDVSPVEAAGGEVAPGLKMPWRVCIAIVSSWASTRLLIAFSSELIIPLVVFRPLL